MKGLGAISLLYFGLLILLPNTLLAQTTYYPAKGIYNGFLDQINIVECDNNNDTSVKILLSVNSAAGLKLGQRKFTLSAFGSVHTILNDLVNITNKIGTYSLTLENGQEVLGDRVNCRTAFYRPTRIGSKKQFEYAYVLPVQNPQIGTTAGIYNSFDPSGAANLTYNWLSVINFDKSNFSANIDVYNLKGLVSKTIPITNLPPNQRIDLPLGHVNGQATGLYVIRPQDPSQLYDAFLVRYNNAEAGGFNFAFPLRALGGSCAGEPLLASTMGNGLTDNWLEIANANSMQIYVTVEIRDRNGSLLHSERRSIPSFGQSNVYLSAIIDPNKTGNVGSARVLCEDPSDKLIVQTAFYGHVPGKIPTEWAYATQGRGDAFVRKGSILSAPVNTFVGMANWLKIADSSLQSSVLNFNVYNQAGHVLASGDQGIAAAGTADIGAHALSGSNVVGSIVTSPTSDSAAYSGEMLRVLNKTDGQIGNIVSIPGIIQQAGVSGISQIGFRGDPQSLAPYRDKISFEEASHLYTKAAFGASEDEVSLAVDQGLRETIDKLMQIVPTPTLDAEAFNWIDGEPNPDAEPIAYDWDGVRRFWTHQIRYSPNRLKEKMAVIFHDLFATSCSQINSNYSKIRKCYEHVQLLRNNSLGNFRDFLQQITTDYAMLYWLNGNLNRLEAPDENFAREHWELFTVGETTEEGGRYPRYTSQDIAEAARAFTGWTTQHLGGVEQSVFVATRHDYGNKTLWKDTPYEVSGNFDAQDIVNLTLDRRPESAQFVSRRIFTALVHDHPSRALVNQMAELLKRSNWEIAPLVSTILNSEAFFSVDARNSRVRDPITFLVGFLRQTGLNLDTKDLDSRIGAMGMVLTDPPDVNGWPLNKYGEAYKSDYFLAWMAQYQGSILKIIRTADDTPQDELALLLPNSAATAEQVVDHLAKIMNIRLSETEREVYINYMDTIRKSNGQIAARKFDPRISNHVREKVAGMLWLLSMHDSYMTY